MKKLLFTVVVFISIVNVHAQTYYFKHYQTDDGLSENSVNCGVQDKKGFMWFGTINGLNRFDGYNFKNYTHNPNEPGSIGNNGIISLFESLEGLLYVGTGQGLFRYDDLHESFFNINDSRIGKITDINEDGQGNIWFISDGKIASLSKKTGSVKLYSIRKGEFSALCITPSKNIWIADINGDLLEYNQNKDIFSVKARCGNSDPTHSNAIVKIIAIDKDKLLIGTKSEGAKILFTNTGLFETLPISVKSQSDLLIKDLLLNGNEIWISTEDGIYVYNRNNNSTTSLKKDSNNPYALSDNFGSFLFKDKENSIWAGTAFGGINFYSPTNSQFNKYYSSSHEYSLTGNIMNNICQDINNNSIWISTADAGLNKLNLQKRQFERVNFIQNKNGSPSNIPSLLLKDNELWIGTYEHGLYVINPNNNKLLKHYERPQNANGLDSNFIVCLFRSHSNKIYVGTAGGLFVYNDSSDLFIPIIHDYIKSISEDHSGKIWIGTLNKGAIRFDPENKSMQHYEFLSNNKNSLWSNTVNTIIEDSKQNIWFGTDEGLCKLSNDKTYVYRLKLPFKVILNILEDSAGSLWISTRTGLIRMDRDNNKQLQIFTKSNGLPTNEFNYASAFKDRNGVMYFGTCKGLVSFDPLKLSFTNYNPPVYLTSLKINNTEEISNYKNSPLKQSIVLTNKIILNHSQSSISIDFAALSFVAPKTLKYAYKMIGLDDNWVFLNSNRTVYFTDLKPGKYTFLVKAANVSGIWSAQPCKIIITINPPWWASNLAYCLYFIGAAVFVYFIAKNYHQRSQEKVAQKFKQFENEKQREMYNAKIEFFTHVTHEIRTPLTLIKGPLENILKNIERSSVFYADLTLMDRNTARLLDLTNQLLDLRKTEIDNFNLTFTKIDITELLTDVRLDFEPLIKIKNYKVSMEMPSSHIWAEVDADALRKILSNLFTNAIKYAKGNISFKLYANEHEFFIEAQNDGLVIPTELREKIFEPFYRLQETNKQQGNGIGLGLSRSLAVLHHGTLVVSDKSIYLNTFILSLPIHQNNAIILKEDLTIVNSDFFEPDDDDTKTSILIVDDNSEIIEFIYRSIVKYYIVYTAENGQDALNILKSKRINLIVSDVMMPVMDGFEFCDQVKNNIEFSHIPFILLTAKNTLESKIEGLESGADVYIEKPFSPEHLLVQIKSLIKNREMVKAYFASSPIVNIKDIAYSKSDENFVERLNNIILDNISDSTLDVNLLADKMNMSRATLYRKIKAISNLSPNELINLARLKKAAELLAEGRYKIFEISFMVGFNSQTYFGHAFLKQFKMTPSDYAQLKRNEKTSIIS